MCYFDTQQYAICYAEKHMTKRQQPVNFHSFVVEYE